MPVSARHVAAALAFAGLLVASATSHAEFLTEDFAPLRAELVQRRDNDFAGTLDKATKKQQKAVQKSLAALDKKADDLADDVKTASKVSGLLSKAYREEFSVTINKVENVAFLLGQLTESLTARVEAEQQLVEARAEFTTGKSAKAVAAKARAARKKLDAAAALHAADPKRLKALTAAAKAAAQGAAAADKAVAKSGEDSIVMAVDGVAWIATGELGQVYTQDDTLHINGERNLDDGTFDRFLFFAKGVSGPGHYELDPSNSNITYRARPGGGSEVAYQIVSGTLDVAVRDIEAPHVSVRFDLTLSNNAAGTLRITSGSAEIRKRFFLSNSVGLP